MCFTLAHEVFCTGLVMADSISRHGGTNSSIWALTEHGHPEAKAEGKKAA